MPRYNYKSLREAILAVLGEIPASKEVAVKEVAAKAVKRHPVDGKTPLATAGAIIYTLAKKGELKKGERGHVFGEKTGRAVKPKAKAKATPVNGRRRAA